ncbi:RCC1 domain-containing protein 1 [Chironomus tepperi]|uniref:RCC1 domain-containing protein 1 n=1 Tax=Chironomus tepperi TaxID=113505 RepID=UPI00391FA409
MKNVLKVAGFNFNKLDSPEDLKLLQFTDVKVRDSKNFLVSSGPFYEIIIYNDLMELDVKSSILKEIENIVKIESKVKQVICSEDNCYLLHFDGKVSQYNVMSKLSHPIELSLKTSSELITQISATSKALFGISSTNSLYKILPTVDLIHEFQKHQKIKKMESGLEHTLILTSNGDVYSFGCCLRGQLGLGTMSVDEPVKLIDALGGIKIIDISCSAFCSIAVSSFGDVYSFGWNTNGQLGIKKVTDRCKQVYSLPEIVESIENELDPIISVSCGYKHTILRTEKHKLYASGLNNYGQLGINKELNEIDEFREINVEGIDKNTILCCGYWTTYLINYVQN